MINNLGKHARCFPAFFASILFCFLFIFISDFHLNAHEITPKLIQPAQSHSSSSVKTDKPLKEDPHALTLPEINQLLSVLENSAQRKEFIKTLKILAKVHEVQRPSQYITGEGGILYRIIQPFQDGLKFFFQWIQSTFSQLLMLPQEFSHIYDRMKTYSGWEAFGCFFLVLGLATVTGWRSELFIRRILQAHFPTISTKNESSKSIWQNTLRLMLLDLLPIGFFCIISLFSANLLAHLIAQWIGAPWEKQVLVSASSCLIAFLFVRLCFHSVLYVMQLMEGQPFWNKRFLYGAVSVYVALHALVQMGLSSNGYQLLLKFYGLLILSFLLSTLWVFRELFISHQKTLEKTKLPQWLQMPTLLLMRYWWLIIGGLFLNGYAYWVSDMLIEELGPLGLSCSLLMILVFSPHWHESIQFFQKGRWQSSPFFSYITPWITPFLQCIVMGGLISSIFTFMGIDMLSIIKNPVIAPVLTTIFSIVLILSLAWFTWILSCSLINERIKQPLSMGKKPTAFILTFFPILRSILQWIIVVCTILLVLQELGFPVVPILYGVSVLGLAVSLGCQNLVKDIINGFITLMEGVIAVGEVVQIGQNKGKIEFITLRGIKLRHSNGALQSIPFSEISSIVNLSRDYSIVPIQLSLPFRADVGKISEILESSYEAMKKNPLFGAMILSPLTLRGIEKFTPNAILLSGSIKITPDPGQIFAQEFNKILKENMDNAWISTV